MAERHSGVYRGFYAAAATAELKAIHGKDLLPFQDNWRAIEESMR